MNDILFNAQETLLNALSLNTNIQTLLGATPRIYDHVPEDATFPYVVFGPLRVEPNDAKWGIGFELLVTFNIWSRYRGGKETREIFQALYDALNRANLEDAISCAFHSADFGLDADGLTYHAAARFALVTQSA